MTHLTEESRPQIILTHLNIDCEKEVLDSLYSLRILPIREPELFADVVVFDLNNLFITAAAQSLLSKLFILPGFIVREYALHYRRYLYSRLAKGKNAGRILVSKLASLWIPTQTEFRGITAIGITLETEKTHVTALCICSWTELLAQNRSEPLPDSIQSLRRLLAESMSVPDHG